jgi:hypothetical protein
MVKEDTALAADLGLSGTQAGIPSPGHAADTRAGTKVGSRVGVNVFGDMSDSTAGRADPMAQTSIGSGIQDQINLEGVGSGSGLLDLTRESDDTSLGAELLDEISPSSGTVAGARRGTVAAVDSGLAMETPRTTGRSAITAPVYVEASDSMTPAIAMLALFGALVLLFGIYVLLNAVSGVRPELVAGMSGPGKDGNGKGMIYLLIAAGVGIVFFVIGLIAGKMAPQQRR